MDAHSLECLDFARVRELLAGYALTSLGRGLAEGIRPATRLELVRRWLAQVTELQQLIEERGGPPFGGISDVREILSRCGPPLRVTVEEVAQVARTLEGTHAVATYLRDLPPDRPELLHLAGRIGDFRTIAERIRRVIDDRGQVRDDASPKLAELRREIEQATRQIRETLERLLRDNEIRRLLQYANHTFHGDRLVLPLKSEYHGRLPGIIHRASDSGATLYVEPAEIVELNNQISNLRVGEQEEVGRLLWDLTHELHLNVGELRKTLDALSVLDLIAAKTRFARDFELRCPTIREEAVLNVRGARHPLLLDLFRRRREAGGDPGEVVPIDYRVGQDFNLLIVTGPNTGGKTVTLKTIGLLCLMVQAGVPVPVAAGSEFGAFDDVLIDVGDEQSMQQSLSTFSAHLTRLLDMLARARPRVLLLIDELGAGTDPDEGAALGRAILDELLRLQCRALVTTHLGALKSFALTRQGAENACVEFDSVTLCPTFHLRIGEPGESNAIAVAQRLGMSRKMVAAARRNLSWRAKALHAALEGTRQVKRQAEDARRLAETAHQEATAAQRQADAARTRLERQQADFERWLQRVVHLRPGDPVRVRGFDRDGRIVRMRLDQQRAEVDVGAFTVEVPLGDVLPPETPAPPPKPPRLAVHAGRDHPRPRREPRGGSPARPRVESPRPPRERPEPALPSLTPEEAAALQPLEEVYVKRFHRAGRVVRVKTGKQLVLVSVGLLEVEVPFDGLARPMRIEPPLRPAAPRPVAQGASASPQAVELATPVEEPSAAFAAPDPPPAVVSPPPVPPSAEPPAAGPGI
jgi:DNA mismatch repair protein MutS2